MAMLGEAFDATQVKPSGTRTLIPAGPYPAQVLRSDVIDTKANDGSRFVWVELELTDGEFAGSTIEARFNLWNKSAKAVEIGAADFSALCHACGELNVTDTAQLHFKPLVVVVKVKPAVFEADGVTVKYGPQSEVAGYRAMPAEGPSAVQRPAAPPPVQQAAPPPPAATQGRPASPPPANAPSRAGGAPWHQNKAA